MRALVEGPGRDGDHAAADRAELGRAGYLKGH